MNVVVWIPFGDLMHGETEPGGKYWNQCVGNRDWWRKRAEVFKQYAVRSIDAQRVPPTLVVCGVAFETPEGHADFLKDAMRSLKRAPGMVFYHKAADTLNRGQCPPAEFIYSIRHLAPFALLWLDSDDMYSREAIAMIRMRRVDPGLVSVFRRGYLYSVADGRIFVYDPGDCPPPFFSRVYVKNAFKDMGTLDAYEKHWRYHEYHHKLPCSRNREDMPSGHFMVVAHDSNTTTVLTNDRIAGKLVSELVTRSDKESTKREFGL